MAQRRRESTNIYFLHLVTLIEIDARSNLIVGVRGQPLGEDLLVQPLERLGHPAGAGEHRPGVGRDGAGGEAIRDLPGGIVVVGDEIFKLISAHALVQVDAVYAAHHLAAACGEVLRPELGTWATASSYLKVFARQSTVNASFHNLAIHVLTTFQCHFDPKRSKGTDRASAFRSAAGVRP